MNSCVITISRGFGSGGRTIGQMLAKQMGIPFYDREILRLASEESGIHEKYFGQVDETLKRRLFRLGTNVYKGELIAPDSSDFTSDRNLFNYQAQVIESLADDGPCVIVGRCADFVLREYRKVLRLFVFAPREDCVDTIASLYGLSFPEAEKLVVQTDKRRSAYYRYYTGQEWTDAGNYDLAVNSSVLGFDGSAALIRDMVERLGQ